ncbi:MAG: cyclopropane-fatty-acyl-phospholipid synthase family protein [Myxococcales bacterium]|jgi:cyclopropane-fatty-acyl-phospholipid synthase
MTVAQSSSIQRAPASTPSALRALSSLAEPALRRRLSSLRDARLIVEQEGRRRVYGDQADTDGLTAVLRIHDRGAWGRVALRGALGAGEGYALGEWSSPEPTAVVQVLLRNRQVLYGLNRGLSRLSAPLTAAMHAARRNTRVGSKRNIAAHYDLSNDFFELLLDETMTYSSGIFEDDRTSLAEASRTKLDRLCQLLELGPDDHLLEIGTGWGSMAMHAAREYGCRVTTTTISEAQYELAGRRIREAGLSDRVTLLRSDYRDLRGEYDKLVSVEMIEAVGHQFFGTYFESCRRLLRPGGQAALQAIVIGEADYARARDTVDFIKAHVFPGCCIPSIAVLLEAASAGGGFKLDHLDAFGTHYARTLAAWRENLTERQGRARELGLHDPQLRAWDYYLSYCEGGFRERHIDLVQMRLSAPR